MWPKPCPLRSAEYVFARSVKVKTVTTRTVTTRTVKAKTITARTVTTKTVIARHEAIHAFVRFPPKLTRDGWPRCARHDGGLGDAIAVTVTTKTVIARHEAIHAFVRLPPKVTKDGWPRCARHDGGVDGRAAFAMTRGQVQQRRASHAASPCRNAQALTANCRCHRQGSAGRAPKVSKRIGTGLASLDSKRLNLSTLRQKIDGL
jgi:hypothetical protein